MAHHHTEAARRLENIIGHLRNAADDVREDFDGGMGHAHIALDQLKQLVADAKAMKPEELELADMDAWTSFAAENHGALCEQYGSIEAALKHARDGGLTMGGGAAPITHIYFAA